MSGVRVLAATAALVVVAGCGTGSSAGTTAAPVGGDEPVTAPALAWVAATYTGDPSSAGAETDAAEEFARDGVGAELRFGDTGEDDGDVLVVAVGRGLDPATYDCARNRGATGCVEVDGATVWWEAATSEDPGVVFVVAPKDGDAAALLFASGPAVTGDPRRLDLPIPVEDLVAIARDPRVDLTTSAEAIARGRDLPWWRDQASYRRP